VVVEVMSIGLVHRQRRFAAVRTVVRHATTVAYYARLAALG
jgi:hypothetical protein